VESQSPHRVARQVAALLGAFLFACGGGGAGGPGPAPPVGELVPKPGGGLFMVDPHQGGNARDLRLVEVVWGRLVDVHDVDQAGEPGIVPILRDVVVGENVLSDGASYELQTNPITHRTRLVILRPRDTPEFAALLRGATATLAPIIPKNDDGTSSEPFSFVARNAALLLRFDDLLDDRPEVAARLPALVRLAANYPPRTPFPGRIVFDPNHGGLRGERFHSTRVLVDLTVSEEEAADLPYDVPVNALGLPASSEFTGAPSAALRLPTRTDPASGRFELLRNAGGSSLLPEGPLESPSDDLVRAMRAGNGRDPNGGFLLDLERPRIVGTWELLVTGAEHDPAGPAGFGFVLDLRFTTPCRAPFLLGDLLLLGQESLEVIEPSGGPDPAGALQGLRVRRFGAEPLGSAAALLGFGHLLTPYRRTVAIEPACWFSFVPPARDPPGRGVPGEARVGVRFSEPMDPAYFRAFDTLRLVRGSIASTSDLIATNIVIGDVRFSADLQEFSFVPRLPLASRDGRDYHLELVGGQKGVRDLGGNPLVETFGRVDFELDPDEPPRANGGVALRFSSTDELLPIGRPDLRGQLFLDGEREIVLPRAAAFASAPADRGNPVPGLMLPFALGVQTPLSPLGSKVQAVWRYADFGWRVADESRHNLDVAGMSWAPVAGAVVADFYPDFEIRVAHSKQLPDETAQQSAAPRYPNSGLAPGPVPYTDNILLDALSPQKVVHPRPLGYRLNPADLYVNGHGIAMMPFPWNRGPGAFETYTWRDTAVLARGGFLGSGIPLDIEVGQPLFLEMGVGSLAPAGQVPSIGLPLLWEVRCYPSSSSIGLNALDIMLPVPGFPQPNFRAFSTGGIDSSGRPVTKDPDLELFPSGGFNPNSRPPGQPTPLDADNSFYVGQIDVVVRVSRGHTVWIDTGLLEPRYAQPVTEPAAQVEGTRIVLEYRGADGFTAEAGETPFDAQALDWYGDVRTGSALFHGDGTWSEDIRSADGARYLQVRFSFFNDIETRLSPVLDSLGIAYEE
jgi:hypothetical protein